MRLAWSALRRASSVAAAQAYEVLDVSRASSMIHELSRERATAMSLRTLFDFASTKSTEPHDKRRVVMAEFLQRELPIRMAQRIVELEQLPFGLGACPDVRWVIDTYSRHVERLAMREKPSTPDLEESFATDVHLVLRNRVQVPKRLAMAVRRANLECRERIDEAMDRFFVGRIGLRLLVEHYLSARTSGGTGEISSACCPGAIATAAADVAARLCTAAFGQSPRVDVVGDLDATFTYSPAHCRYVILELLKNSCRAVTEEHAGKPLPSVRVVVACGDEDVSLKISDSGGGFTRPEARRVFSWFYSNKELPPNDREETNDPALDLSYGHGLGLPLARAHCRYFGGDLELKAMQGAGVDAYIHLSRLGTDCENLPLRVVRSPAHRASTI